MERVGQMDNTQTKKDCPCCGEKTIDEIGRFDICPICNWEDDNLQRDEPDFSGGANKMSLNQARAAYKAGKPVE